MAHVSRTTAQETIELDGFTGHYGELDGYTVGFETYTADADVAELFRGLPDDRCQCPHWGYVVKGKVTFHFADRDETYQAGDAYYAPPGHTPEIYDGTELVEFSPTDALGETMAVVTANLEAAGAV
jgi:hypothetical protein